MQNGLGETGPQCDQSQFLVTAVLMGKDDGELVPTQAPDGGVGTGPGHETGREMLEEDVTELMAVGIIGPFQPVGIKHHDQNVGMGGDDGVGSGGEGRPGGQAGERIMPGLIEALSLFSVASPG